eukprot:TRINITY_DN23735_c0_g1_i1.p1 TRINITY_DN23735_c0_g1~~TRINITY_DN23735_c0_g1_i1.p1  ORF type:complete len:291 (+),score=26.58 TRINITY_DN23735_c0_g1_i1:122-994(+)
MGLAVCTWIVAWLCLLGRFESAPAPSTNESDLHGLDGSGPTKIGWIDSQDLNCSISRCNNAENLCGDYAFPCKPVARIPQGPQIWLSVHFSFVKGDRYKREERASMSKELCEADRSFMQIVYEGDFKERGPSPATLGYHWAQVDVTRTWVKLMVDEACVQVEEYSFTDRCVNVYDAIKSICPCNGWPWSAQGAPRTRNLGAFCGQPEQCPILHEVVMGKPHYYSYKANTANACFSRKSLSREVGWWAPLDDGCYKKDRPTTCPAGYLSGAWRAPATTMVICLAAALQAWL